MKRTCTLLLAILLSFSAFAEEVKIGVFIHAPHVYENDDGAYGPAVDYISMVMKEMGFSPAFRVLPLSRILLYLKTGEIDLSLEIAKSPEREEYALYSEKPVYKMVPSLTLLAAHPLHEITGVSDVRGMKIGFLSGAVIPAFFDSAGTVVFESVSGDTWIQQNLGRLIAGRIDAAMDMNGYSYREEAKKKGMEDQIKTLSIPGEGTDYYVAFSRASPKAAELLVKYNALIETKGYDEQKMIEEFISRKELP